MFNIITNDSTLVDTSIFRYIAYMKTRAILVLFVMCLHHRFCGMQILHKTAEPWLAARPHKNQL